MLKTRLVILLGICALVTTGCPTGEVVDAGTSVDAGNTGDAGAGSGSDGGALPPGSFDTSTWDNARFQ